MNKGMKVLLTAAFAVVAVGSAMAQGPSSTSHMCAYAIDDSTSGNAVEGYIVGHGAIVGAHFGPFSTNGLGTGGGFFAGGKLNARIRNGDMYVDDGGSTNITHFTIDKTNCNLTKDSALYPSGDSSPLYGSGLAITPDGKTMFTGNTGNFSIYSIAINTNGSLGAPVFQQSTSDYPDGFEVSADGKSLIVGYPDILEVCSYAITGSSLGAANCQTTLGLPTGVAIDSHSKCAYTAQISLSNGLTEIGAAPITGPGTIGPVTDYSSFGPAADSQGIVVNWNNKVVYVGSVSGDVVTTGSLSTTGCVPTYVTNTPTGGIVGTDELSQLAQAAKAHGYLIGGDFNFNGTPSMTIFTALSTGALTPIGSGQYALAAGAAPLSVLSVGIQ